MYGEAQDQDKVLTRPSVDFLPIEGVVGGNRGARVRKTQARLQDHENCGGRPGLRRASHRIQCRTLSWAAGEPANQFRQSVAPQTQSDSGAIPGSLLYDLATISDGVKNAHLLFIFRDQR